MNKEEIKTLTDADESLQRWAALLFAEISEHVNACVGPGGYTTPEIMPLIEAKVAEFPKIVLMEAINAAKRKMADE